jgi:hypothetical protein
MALWGRGMKHQGKTTPFRGEQYDMVEARHAPQRLHIRAATDELELRRIAGVLGPTMIAMIASEFPLIQPRLYDAQIPPVVYLSGVLMFVAGLVIVRAHNRWRLDWTILVTLSGWFALALGVVRMFAASSYQHRAATIGSRGFMAVESVLLVCGFVMTYKAYVRRDRAAGTQTRRTE